MTDDRLHALGLVLDEVIPPAADGSMPGAGQLGLAQALIARPDLAPLIEAGLDALDERARAAGAASFAALGGEERRAAFSEMPAAEPAFFSAVLSQTFVAYYQHREVLVALGLGGRPPFPEGYDVPPTDLSILDRVRRRAPFYREP